MVSFVVHTGRDGTMRLCEDGVLPTLREAQDQASELNDIYGSRSYSAVSSLDNVVGTDCLDVRSSLSAWGMIALVSLGR